MGIKAMEYINRKLASICGKDLKTFPVLTLTGPRQCGKSTLLRHILPHWQYVNLEEPASFDFAEEDPRGFFKNYSDQVIIDEIQRVPRLLSQLQVEVDRDRRPGRFAITGSHNLLLMEQVSQSLAGRTAMRNLLPFSWGEMAQIIRDPFELETALFMGGYPSVQEFPEASMTWLDSYIQTYVERDVRMIRNVSDLSSFRRFLRLCAGRAGQLIDLSGIGNDVGISHNTVRDWVNVLEAGFIIFRLDPYFRNYSKRIIKNSKMYFYDTALLCRLLEIRSPSDLLMHPFRGAIFENWCVVEVMKYYLNNGQRPSLYFWRDQVMEVDILAEISSRQMAAVECKSGRTAVTDFLSTPLKLKSIAKDQDVIPTVVYGGDQTQVRSDGTISGWRDFANQLHLNRPFGVDAAL